MKARALLGREYGAGGGGNAKWTYRDVGGSLRDLGGAPRRGDGDDALQVVITGTFSESGSATAQCDFGTRSRLSANGTVKTEGTARP